MIAYHQTLQPEALCGPELDSFLARGWYRMHQTIFTTTHLIRDEFYRVHWLRYPLREIGHHDSHKRIRKRNSQFRYVIEKFNGIREDHEELYVRYRAIVDFEGALTIRQGLFGEEEVDRGIYNTYCISMYDRDHLIAGGYFDVGQHAGTSILHFYDPRYAQFSPGKYLMLLTADFLFSSGYELYYPGYLMAGHEKMNYKLFIGREITQYFDVISETWKSFDESILVREELTPVQQLEVLVAFGG